MWSAPARVFAKKNHYRPGANPPPQPPKHPLHWDSDPKKRHRKKTKKVSLKNNPRRRYHRMDPAHTMPKFVDHEGRRRELIETTWRIIARRGLSAATMRQIASEAGFANGALKPYFPTKSDLLHATYSFVVERTETRIAHAVRGATGLEALAAFCAEIAPTRAELLEEAHIVVAFWELAASNTQRKKHLAELIEKWENTLVGYLDQAADAGHIHPELDRRAYAAALMSFLEGSQLTAVMAPDTYTPHAVHTHIAALIHAIEKPAASPSNRPRTPRV